HGRSQRQTGRRGGDVYVIANEGLNTLAGLQSRIRPTGARAEWRGEGPQRVLGGQRGGLGPVWYCCEGAAHSKSRGGAAEARGSAGRCDGRTGQCRVHDPATHDPIARREPGVELERWLTIELQLVADVGFLGIPNTRKSTLLASAGAARPKIASGPYTTIVPNLGMCDLEEEESVAQGTGLGFSFLRHVRRCKVFLHVVDGTSEDPEGDFEVLNGDLAMYDSLLARNEVNEKEKELVEELREAAGHSRVRTISAATTRNMQELMGGLKKFVDAEKLRARAPRTSLRTEIVSDPPYPGQFCVPGPYIKQVTRMTHWEYPKALEPFERQLKALCIADELIASGAQDGDWVMIDEYDFDFALGMTNPNVPHPLVERKSGPGCGRPLTRWARWLAIVLTHYSASWRMSSRGSMGPSSWPLLTP
ncbi:LOW QUALITY PROTEIN: hypothetical protein ACHAWF_002065, partial [Thalassiosira exigua]